LTRGCSRGGEESTTSPARESVQVPATVQAVLAARIDRLPPEEKRLLREVAVVGKDVLVGLLRAVSQLTEDEVRAPLHPSEFPIAGPADG
jgi:predicted ATPase